MTTRGRTVDFIDDGSTIDADDGEGRRQVAVAPGSEPRRRT